MAEVAADEVAVLLEEAAERAGRRARDRAHLRARAARSGSASAARGTATTSTTSAGAVAVAGPPAGLARGGRARRRRRSAGTSSRDGVVFVQAVEGRDIDALVRRTGEASAAVLEALFALAE